MHRSLSRVSIRSIADSFCRYKSFEKGKKNAPERKECSRSFVNSEGFSKLKSDAKSVGSLQAHIVNALQSGERDKASKFLSVLVKENVPLRLDDFVYILNYCARSPDPLFVMETWRVMEEKEIDINKRCYTYIIQALMGGGYPEEVFDMSQSQNPNISSMASNAALEAQAQAQASSRLKRQSDDVGWEFGILNDPMNTDKWKCKLCGKESSGGVYRLKKHIAGTRGDVAPCQKSSTEDKAKCKAAIEGSKKKKNEKTKNDAEIRKEVEIEELEEIESIEIGGSSKRPRSLGPMDRFATRINPDDHCMSESKRKRQQSISDALYKERTLQVYQYMARWVYESGIPFYATDNDSFKRFVEAVGQFGPGYHPPSQYQLREPLLKGEVERTRSLLKTQVEEWERNGCSIMTDAWSDRTRRSIMNLCVNCRSGTTFLSSKEASQDAHTGEYIFEYVDKCIEEVGSKNVVQVVTDNASNNMAAADMLYEKRPSIFWSSCATHTMNLMLEGIGKLSLFKTTITKAKNFTIFIYSHHKTLALMRKCTKREIVRPRITRFATAFLTLQSLIEKKEELRQMVNSNAWESTKWSKSTKGKAAYATVVQPSFWIGIALCLKVFTPLVKVLRLVDGDVKPSMGFVYGELLKAKEDIKEALRHKVDKYTPILNIVDVKGKGRIDSPLHLTSYLLNPYYYFKTPSMQDDECLMEGVFSCIERFHPDLDMQDKVINVELVKYKNREGAFGRALAAKGCEKNDDTYDPVGWWSNYGNHTPNLQKVAKKILSLTTSSSGCERNWSVFEGAFNCLSFLAQCPHNLPDLPMYNTFLIGCARIGSMVYVDSCLDLMENQMLGKSEITYLALLKLAVLQQNLFAVQEIWKQFNKYYSPNIFVLQTFIRSFTSLGDLVSACEALELAVAQVLRRNAFAWRSVKEMFQSPTLDIPIPSTNDLFSKSCSLTVVEKTKRCSISTTIGGLAAALEGNTRENYVDMFSVNGALYDLVKYPNKTSIDADTDYGSFALVPVANQSSCFGVRSSELENGSSEMLNRSIEAIPAKNVLRPYNLSEKEKFVKRTNKYMTKIFNIVIHACARARNCELAEQLFLQMQKLGLEPSGSTYEGLIRALVYTREEPRGVIEGLKLLKAMEGINVKPSDSILGTLSIACSKILELDLAEALLDAIVESPWIFPFNALLAAYDVMDRPERAVRLLAKMKQLKLKSDIRTYELLFSLFGTVNAPYEKWDVASHETAAKRIEAIEMDMERNGVQHSLLSMRNLLRAFGEEGMGSKINQYLYSEKPKFIPTDPFQGTTIYNTALHSLVESHQMRCTFAAFKDMRMRNFPLDAATYDIMIQWCSLLRCFNSACVFVSMMLRDGFYPQTCTYTNLIKILVANSAFDEALHLLYQMRLEGIRPDVVLFNTILLKAYLKGRFDIIELIVEQMHRERIQPDPETCSYVFCAYASHGFISTAMEALQVLSMRMISSEESILQANSRYFEDKFIFAEDSNVELRVTKIFENSGEYLASALLNLRWCAIAGFSISWSPDQSEWAKQLSSNYSLKSDVVKGAAGALKGTKGISRPAAVQARAPRVPFYYESCSRFLHKVPLG